MPKKKKLRSCVSAEDQLSPSPSPSSSLPSSFFAVVLLDHRVLLGFEGVLACVNFEKSKSWCEGVFGLRKSTQVSLRAGGDPLAPHHCVKYFFFVGVFGEWKLSFCEREKRIYQKEGRKDYGRGEILGLLPSVPLPFLVEWWGSKATTRRSSGEQGGAP